MTIFHKNQYQNTKMVTCTDYLAFGLPPSPRFQTGHNIFATGSISFIKSSCAVTQT